MSAETRPVGLSSRQVADRRAHGQTNLVVQRTSRTIADIVRANVLTRFNAIVTALLVIVLFFGELPDTLFGLVMISNSAIGIVQEIRAKRTLDSLHARVEPITHVIRDGTDHTVPSSELVLDDLLRLSTGDQIPVDGTIIRSDRLEVDESSLTGEADPVPKATGDPVRSASAVVAGSGLIVATAVGADAWAHRLTSEAREFTLTTSELRQGIDRLLRWITWVLVPVAGLLFVTQTSNDQNLADGLISAVAGVIAMVPQGLVLLVSMSMAIAVLRLSRHQVLTQELAAVEGLARVDVICLDKTGTLTTGALELDTVEAFDTDTDTALAGLAALAAATPSSSSTIDVIAAAIPPPPSWILRTSEPFSAARKWSAATFADHGTWILGAPEVLLDTVPAETARPLRARVDALATQGRRVLLLTRTGNPMAEPQELPIDHVPVALVILREQIRADAAETLAYLTGQNIATKIISGDNPLTVAAIASTLGVPDTTRTVDLRSEAELGAVAHDGVIFGRAQPEPKRQLIEALQRAGHTVAMTGDGVNDIPAVKQADIGIAMDTATPATKAVSQLVLLDGRFDRLPLVIAEGRRVVANMERVSALFVTKTIYATLLAVAVGIAGLPFPFLPRHLSLIGAITIGIPAFILSFWPSQQRARPGYLRRTMRLSIPAGSVAAVITLAVYAVARSSLINATQAEARTAATLTLTIVGIWILYRLIRPLDRAEAAMLAGLLATVAAAFTIPSIAEFYALDPPRPELATAIAAAAALNIAILEIVHALLQQRRTPLTTRSKKTRPGNTTRRRVSK